MVALVFLSILFFRERAWFLDIAYQTFLMINEGTVQIMVNRFGAALVQMLPLIGIKLNAPIWVISLLYSVSFTLLFLLFYHLIVRVFRNDFLGWALVLLYTLIVFDGFYWATSELQQGLGLLLLFFAFLHRFPKLEQWWAIPICVASSIALVYYHPLVFIPFFFLWIFFLLHAPKDFHNLKYWLLAGLVIALLIVKSKYSGNWYDDNKYRIFLENLKTYFPNYWDFPANFKFLKNCLSIWYCFPLLLLANTIAYVKWKKWWKLGLVWSFCLGYILLNNIGSPNANYRFYAEVNYMPLSIFVAIPFLFDLVPKIKNQKRLLLFFLLLMVIRIGSIAYNHQPFKQRLVWLEKKIKHAQTTTTTNRYLISNANAPQDTLLMTWGIPYETLLMTANHHPDSSKTLYVSPQFDRYQEQLKQDSVFLSDFKAYHESELNQRYFRLKRNFYKNLYD